ncbi:MAG: ParB/RepB/Spo0J family partition protein [Pseudomonadota bacterium]
MSEVAAMGKKGPVKGLGRGLSALLGEDVRLQPEGGAAAGEGLAELAIDLILPNAAQPRQRFEEAGLDELAASIREKGVLQPILVRPLAADPGLYEIVAGERRWRAAQKAQLHKIPVLIQPLDDDEALALALIENIQRADLTPMEEARGYRRLIDDFGQGQEAVAQAVGKSRSHVANMLRLLRLPALVQAMLDDGRLSMGHGRALANAAAPELLARRVVDEGLSVRETEALAQGARAKGARRGGRAKPEKDADTRALEGDMSAALGLKVVIGHKGKAGGQVAIHYKTLDQLDEVCQRLCRDPHDQIY